LKRSVVIASILLSLLFSKGEVVFAQTVTIPDTNFAAYLHTIIPSAISGNQLDTGSSAVKHLTYIDVMLKHISSLEGIQYFTSLTYLNCAYNNLTSLPALPNSLQVLGCGTNPLPSLPALPNTLKQLNCSGCSLTVLPSLPNTLKQLLCGSCKIYDRWGAMLYQWTDINAGWNGKDKNGTASTDGTYFYVITYTDNTGKTNAKNGFFQLLR